MPKALCLVHEGFGNGDNLWVELGWVQRPHEAFAGGEMGRLHQWLLGVHFRTSTHGLRGGQQSPSRGGEAPKLLTSLSPSGFRDLEGQALARDPEQVSAPLVLWNKGGDADGCPPSFAEQTPKGASGDGPPASEKEPIPPVTEKDLGPPKTKKDPGALDPKKNPDPPSLKKDSTEAPGPEKTVDPALAAASSQGPSGEGDGGGGPAEGSAGPPAALPQPTTTADATSIQKLDAKQAPSGDQESGEAKAGQKAAERLEAGRRGSPAFLHSPSCPAIISW